MKIVGIMPLKLNNERLPGKNTLFLGNKPLLRHQLDVAKDCAFIDDIYVYCSDPSIVDYLDNNIHFLQRDKTLDLPTSNFNQIFSSFMNAIDADIYVYIHATAPFISLDTYNECLEAVKSGKYDSAFCAVKIQDFLWQDNKPLNFDSTNLPRSQDLTPIYRETSGIYVFTKEVFTKLGRRIGLKPYIKELSYRESVDINTKEDFDLAQMFIRMETR